MGKAINQTTTMTEDRNSHFEVLKVNQNHRDANLPTAKNDEKETATTSQKTMEHENWELKRLAGLREQLLKLSEQISRKCLSGKLSIPKILNVLLKHSCERCIVELLSGTPVNDAEPAFDNVWRNLHEYAASLFIERLKNRLTSESLKVAVITEGENSTGRYDILVLNGRTLQVIDERNGKRISLEFKMGLNLDFRQVEKYLWNDLTLILVRIATGHVATFRTSEWADFLLASLTDRIREVERVLSGNALIVPGEDCYVCPVNSCRFKKNRSKTTELIKPENLEELLENFKTNIYPAIEDAVEKVSRELQSGNSGSRTA